MPLAGARETALRHGETALVYPGASTSYYFKTATDFLLPKTWTIETWVKPHSAAASKYWLSFSNDGNNCMLLQCDMFATVGRWYYVVVTYGGSSSDNKGGMKVYVDGAQTSDGIHDSFCGRRAGCLVFNQDQDTLGGGFDALQSPGMEQDTVAIYSYAWKSNEIVAAKSCTDRTDPDLYALWVGSGRDASGYGNDAAAAYSTKATGVTCPGISRDVNDQGIDMA